MWQHRRPRACLCYSARDALDRWNFMAAGSLAIASVTINSMNGAQGAGRCAGQLLVQTALALAGIILAAQAGRSMSVALGGLALTGGGEVWSRWA